MTNTAPLRPTLLTALVLAGCAAAERGPPRLVLPAPAPPPGLERILGRPAEAVTALLGPASLDRSEGPARQLQFIRPPCVLDVFLYPPASGGAQQVRTATARKADGSRMDPGTCLGLIAPR